MIKTLIIDDEPLALQQLAVYVSKIPFLTLVGECQSALEARDIINNERVDVIFIDINMPDLNGMDFVRSLVAPPLVVFTTAYSEYAIDGFKVDAVDYLLKPFSLDDFRRAALRVKERYEHNNAPLPLTAEPEPEQTDENIFLKTVLASYGLQGDKRSGKHGSCACRVWDTDGCAQKSCALPVPRGQGPVIACVCARVLLFCLRSRRRS